MRRKFTIYLNEECKFKEILFFIDSYKFEISDSCFKFFKIDETGEKHFVALFRIEKVIAIKSENLMVGEL